MDYRAGLTTEPIYFLPHNFQEIKQACCIDNTIAGS
jgi:hypothetical protein